MLGMATAGRCGASAGAVDALARTGCTEPLDWAVGAESFAEGCMANHAPAPMAMAATATAIGTRVLRDNGGAACAGGAGAATAARAVASTTVASACRPAATPAPGEAIDGDVTIGAG